MKINYRLVVFSMLFILIGCNSNSNNTTTNKTKQLVDTQGFKIESFEIGLIGRADKKLELEKLQNENTKEGIDYTNTWLDSLPNKSNRIADMSNKDDRVKLTAGYFYNIKVKFNTKIKYVKGLTFELTLVHMESNKTEKIYSKLLDDGRIKDVNETGKHFLNIQTLIPTDVPNGKYMLVVHLLNTDVNKLTTDKRAITDTPEIGAIYVDIEHLDDSYRIDIVSANGSKFIDLPQSMKFKNSYTRDDIGSVSLAIHNSSYVEENITISAILKLETGKEIKLALLDNNDGKVKSEIVSLIGRHNGNEVSVGDGDLLLHYFLPEASYPSLLNSLPDLSIDKTSDGIKGEIVWTISVQSGHFKTNNIKNNVILTKFIDDILYENNKIFTNKLQKYTSSNSDYAVLSLDSNRKLQNWINIGEKSDGGVTNIPFTSIDASLDWDGDYAYLFADNLFIKYYKSNQVVSSSSSSTPANISTLFPNSNLKNVQAIFKVSSNEVYIFSGSECMIYDIVNKRVVRELSTITDIFPALSNFSDFKNIDAAVNTYRNDIIYLFSGKDYIKYNMRTKSVIGGQTPIKNSFLNDNKRLSAVFYKNNSLQVYSSEPTGLQNLLSSGIFFKIGGEIRKTTGKESTMKLVFDNTYSVKGMWSIPSVSAIAKSHLDAYVLGHQLSMLHLDAEASTGMSTKNPKANNVSVKIGVNNRIGASLKVSVLGVKIYSKNNIVEKSVSIKLTKNNAKKDLDKAKEETKFKNLKMPKYTWKEEKTIVTVRYPLGPIILAVSGGLSGSIKINTSLDFKDVGVIVSLDMPLNMKVFITGGLDYGITKAGIKGDATLVSALGNASLRAGLDVDNSNNIIFSLKPKATATLNMVQANFSLYAEAYTKLLWCKEFLIPYPCGIGWNKWSYQLYQTDWLFNRNWTILDEDIPLATLHI